MPKRILIIEDELPIQSVLKELLLDAGYEVVTANDGVEGIAAFHSEKIDLVLLDIMMPNLDGYSVCKRIRQESAIPVIMLTALDEEEAQIKAYEMQADDYITKPFSLKLVLLHIEAVLRRSMAKWENTGQSHWDNGTDVLYYRDIRLDMAGMGVSVAGTEISLTKIEFDLLYLFLKNPGRVFTREQLLNLVWGYDFAGDEKAVNIHIMNLRHKLSGDYIETVRGVGYKIAKEN